MFAKGFACLAGVFAIFSTATLVSAQSFSVRGGDATPLRALDDSRNNLEVFLTAGADDLVVEFSAPEGAPTPHQWFRYQFSAADAEQVPSFQNGYTSRLAEPLPGYGYFVGLASHPDTRFLYLIDYAPLAPALTAFTFAPTSDPCGTLRFAAPGDLPKILYYTPASRIPVELKRAFTLAYTALEWSEELQAFNRVDKLDVFTDPNAISLLPPLCDTQYRLLGDSFALHFGLQQEFLTELFTATAIEAHADTSLLASDDPPNLYAGSQGFSAPLALRFTATANEPTAFLYVWTVSRDGQDDEPILRYTGKQVDYTFTRAGRYKAALEVSNRDGSCTDDAHEFIFDVSDTFIDIPNAFSPGSTPGVNDEFRIVYKSITRFKGAIFNRWGNQLFAWTDPAVGWDGRRGGQLLPPGVYFYVIEFTDSLGNARKLSGPLHLFNSSSSQP
jgi:gliding motility-associated-like protein